MNTAYFRFITLWLIVFICCLVLYMPIMAQSTLPSGMKVVNRFPNKKTNFTSEYEKLKEAQDLYRQGIAKGDSNQIAEACYLLGKRYGTLGDYLTSRSWFIKSLRIREVRGPSPELGKLYIQLAGGYSYFGQHKEALAYAHRARRVFKHIRSEQGLMGACEILSGVHMSMCQNKDASLSNYKQNCSSLDSAFYYNRLAEKIAIRLDNPKELAIIQLNSGEIWLRRDARRAIPYLKKALAFYTHAQHYPSMVNLQLNLAKAYLSIRQPQSAYRFLIKAQHIYITHKLTDHVQNWQIEFYFAQFYKLTKDWKRVVNHLENAHNLENKGLKADREGSITRLNIEYEAEKKEAQLKTQQQELNLRTEKLRSQKLLTQMTLALFSVAVIASFIFFRLNRKNQRISRRNAELVMEQNHRVKNNLQVISSLLSLQSKRLLDIVAKQAVEESQLRVEAMSMLHRQLYDGERLIEVDMTVFTPDLVKAVLKTYGFNQLKPIYELEPVWLHVDKAVPLGLILNELITNSCKYAFPDHQIPSLKVACYQRDHWTYLQVSDNGPGFTFNHGSNSFGMRLIEMQAEQLDGIYDFKLDNGTTFILSFKHKK